MRRISIKYNVEGDQFDWLLLIWPLDPVRDTTQGKTATGYKI